MPPSTRFRAGRLNPAGNGRRFTPITKTYKCKATMGFIGGGSMGSGDTALSGCGGVFSCLDYSHPLAMHNSGAVTNKYSQCVQDRNPLPTGHAEAWADGFRKAIVRSCMYRFSIQWINNGAVEENAGADFVFAWKFMSGHDVSDIDLAASSNTTSPNGARIQWHDIRATTGWRYKRFSATTAGGSIYPSAGVIDIKVPSIYKLGEAFENNTDNDVTAVTPGSKYQVDISSLTAEQNPQGSERLHLHFIIFTIGGVAMTQDDFFVDADWFGEVTLSREQLAADMVDEVDPNS